MTKAKAKTETALKTPKSMVSQVSQQQAHTEAKVTLADAIQLATEYAVADLNSKFALTCAVALACIIGQHLGPNDKPPVDLASIEAAIEAGIVKAIGAAMPKSSWYVYTGAAKGLYRKLTGVPKDKNGAFKVNERGQNFGGIIDTIANATTSEAAYTALKDHVAAEVCRHTSKVKATFDGLELWVKGKSTNSSKTQEPVDLAKLDVGAASKRITTMTSNIAKMLSGRDNATRATIERDLVGKLPEPAHFARMAFERLLKVDLGAAVKLAGEFNSMVQTAVNAMAVQSTDKPQGDAAQAVSDAANDMAAKHNDNVKQGRKGNPAKRPVA